MTFDLRRKVGEFADSIFLARSGPQVVAPRRRPSRRHPRATGDVATEPEPNQTVFSQAGNEADFLEAQIIGPAPELFLILVATHKVKSNPREQARGLCTPFENVAIDESPNAPIPCRMKPFFSKPQLPRPATITLIKPETLPMSKRGAKFFAQS